MRSLHLCLIMFCQLLLAAFLLYSNTVQASPIDSNNNKHQTSAQHHTVAQTQAHTQAQPKPTQVVEAKSAPVVAAEPDRPKPVVAAPLVEPAAVKPTISEAPVKAAPVETAPLKPVEPQQAAAAAAVATPVEQTKAQIADAPQAKSAVVPEKSAPIASEKKHSQEHVAGKSVVAAAAATPVQQQQPQQKPVESLPKAEQLKVNDGEDFKVTGKSHIVPVAAPAHQHSVQPVLKLSVIQEKQQSASSPAVMGGQGPLHLLAATLCSYQPDKPVADETLNLLYSQRALLRKSLFEFMSLKFTNLERFSSRLSPSGHLEVVPMKTRGEQLDASGKPVVVPAHGWPVVGKCTAHDLKLMSEAAWCECAEGAAHCGGGAATAARSSAPAKQVATDKPNTVTGVGAIVTGHNNVDVPSLAATLSSAAEPTRLTRRDTAAAAKQLVVPPEVQISTGHHTHQLYMQQLALQQALNTQQQQQQQPQSGVAVEQTPVTSRMLHVNDIKPVPAVAGEQPLLSYANVAQPPLVDGPVAAALNALSQQQLASLQAQATSTRECRRNALRLAKSLFNHLAEDQRNASDSWPRLYAQLNEDECARKRMIDVVTALAGFRGETSSSTRRDNVEFAFAMDDLRAKVLESEVNVPLTFDKQFIEVEQFLQQSVKLMLANIDPKRAQLTSMRYRSLMPGPASVDDQCVELHQRLLAKNYPTDCNPTEFGQLPDVLRMAANSLELWSIESEISKYASKYHEYPVKLGSAPVPIAQSSAQHDVNECIANLVSN